MIAFSNLSWQPSVKMVGDKRRIRDKGHVKIKVLWWITVKQQAAGSKNKSTIFRKDKAEPLGIIFFVAFLTSAFNSFIKDWNWG